jgi:hypothetical protein
MANLNRGEVAHTFGDVEYVLRIATNEWCALEEEFGKTTDEILAEFSDMLDKEKLRMKMVRTLFRAALVGRCPDVTEEKAGELMSDMGLIEAAALLGRVIKASMPEESASPRPPKAARAKG